MILLIDNYDSFTHNLAQALMALGAEVKIVRNDEIAVEEIRGVEGIVLSPGPGRPEDAGICVELIQKLSGNVPILGVCLGHQAIAHAFGGNVVRASEIIHGKESFIFHNRKQLFKGVKLPFKAGRYHSLVVRDLPENLQVDAEDPKSEVMALSHREFPVFGVQFHPESILTPEGKTILKNFLELCK